MFRHFLILITLFFLSLSLNAQYFDWAFKSNLSFARGLDVDSNGDVYLLAAGSSNNYGGLNKYDEYGSLIWSKNISGMSYSNFIIIEDHIYIAGSFTVNLNFISVSLIGSGGDSFIAKMDTAGNLIWLKHIHGNLSEHIYDLAIDSFENIYIVGVYNGSIYFSSTDTLNAGQIDFNGFIAKYDSSANFKWANKISGDFSSPYAQCITVADDYIYFSGKFHTTTIFHGTNYNQTINYGSSSKIYLAKYDSLGNIIWVEYYGGVWPTDILFTGTKFLISISSGPNQIFGSTVITSDKGRYVLVVDTSGQVEKVIEPVVGKTYGSGILFNNNDNSWYWGGVFKDTISFAGTNGNLTFIDTSNTPQPTNFFIFKFDSLDNAVWGTSYNSFYGVGSFLAIDHLKGHGYVSNYMSDTFSFPAANGSLITGIATLYKEAILARFSDSTFTTSIPSPPVKDEGKLFKIFPNPSGGEIRIEAPEENYTVIVNDSTGKKLLSKKHSGSATLDLSAVRAKTVVVEIYVKGKKVQAEKIVIHNPHK